jgi:magnesium transporter
MKSVVRQEDGNQYSWVDLCQPTARDLIQVMEQHKLHKTAILDSLDPQHLPKLERFRNGIFLIVRLYDKSAPVLEDELQRMTRKLSIYVNPHNLITIRRDGDCPLDRLITRWKQKGQRGGLDSVAHPLNEILDAVIGSYMDPLEDCQTRLDRLERLTFQDSSFRIRQAEDAYSLIAKSSVIKRMLSQCLHIIDRISPIPEKSRPFFNDIREDGESLLFWVQDIQENTNRILQLQISLEAQRTNEASRRTNEIMRFLTVFSILFMPLNFIAGLYGMNFENMPMIRNPWGFWFSLFAMAASTALIMAWFRRQGWLHRNEEDDDFPIAKPSSGAPQGAGAEKSF